jgi:hypothetical protein
MLPCPSCKKHFDLEAILDACTVSWPNQKWLWFKCPACKRGNHVGLEPDRLSTGGIDGAPGPCFMPLATEDAPGLNFTTEGGGVTVHYNNRKWRFKAR